MAVVSLKDVHKFYPLGKERIEAVRGVSFDIEKGEFAAISGPSGSGKSTILNMIGLIVHTIWIKFHILIKKFHQFWFLIIIDNKLFLSSKER